MPRPRKPRRICALPSATFYKPRGVPLEGLPVMVLSLDGLEALRLADAEGLDHHSAAERMGISRPTFSRLIAEARAVVATALVNGWALGIEGGPVEIVRSAAIRSGCRHGDGPTDGDDSHERQDKTDPAAAGSAEQCHGDFLAGKIR